MNFYAKYDPIWDAFVRNWQHKQILDFNIKMLAEIAQRKLSKDGSAS